LFNDLLIYAAKNFFKKGTLQFRGRVAIKSIILQDVQDSPGTQWIVTNCFFSLTICIDGSIKHAFDIHRLDKKNTFTVCTTSPAEKTVWMNEIQRLSDVKTDSRVHLSSQRDSAADASSEMPLPPSSILATPTATEAIPGTSNKEIQTMETVSSLEANLTAADAKDTQQTTSPSTADSLTTEDSTSVGTQLIQLQRLEVRIFLSRAKNSTFNIRGPVGFERKRSHLVAQYD